jgi:hypothetical protein
MRTLPFVFLFFSQLCFFKSKNILLSTLPEKSTALFKIFIETMAQGKNKIKSKLPTNVKQKRNNKNSPFQKRKSECYLT